LLLSDISFPQALTQSVVVSSDQMELSINLINSPLEASVRWGIHDLAQQWKNALKLGPNFVVPRYILERQLIQPTTNTQPTVWQHMGCLLSNQIPAEVNPHKEHYWYGFR
jgi:hypothetical protein